MRTLLKERGHKKSTSFLAPPALKTLEPPAEKFTDGKLKPVKPEKFEPVVEEENAEEVEANALLARVGKEAACENDGKVGVCVRINWCCR